MGRKKLMKTKKQVEEQNKRWAEAHNRARRERYHRDAEYRKQCILSASKYAEENRELSDTTLARRDQCFKAGRKLSVYAEVRDVYRGKQKMGSAATLSSQNMAAALGLSHVAILHRWQRDGRFPKPDLRVRMGRTIGMAYTMEKAQGYVTIMAEHYKGIGSLKKEHAETIRRLFGV